MGVIVFLGGGGTGGIERVGEGKGYQRTYDSKMGGLRLFLVLFGWLLGERRKGYISEPVRRWEEERTAAAAAPAKIDTATTVKHACAHQK